MLMSEHGPIRLMRYASYGTIMLGCRLRMSSSRKSRSLRRIIPDGIGMSLRRIILTSARRVVILAPSIALPTAAYTIAAIRHALYTRKAYLIPILIYWFQLVSLMQLYPSFPSTPNPGSVSRGCRSTMCCFVSVLRFQFFNIIIHYCVRQLLVHFNIG